MSTTKDLESALALRAGIVPKHAEDSVAKYAMDPLTSKGNEILKNMENQYGPEKGKSVFYASKNKGTISGVDAADGGPGSGPQPGGGSGGSNIGYLEYQLREAKKRMKTAKGGLAAQSAARAAEKLEKEIMEAKSKGASDAVDGGPGSGPQKGGGSHVDEKSKREAIVSLSYKLQNAKSQSERDHLLGQIQKLSGYAKDEMEDEVVEDADCANDAWTDKELDKQEKEKEDAHEMAPKKVENVQPETGRWGGRASPGRR